MSRDEILSGRLVTGTGGTLTLEQFLAASGLTRDELETLMDFGVLKTAAKSGTSRFPALCVERARIAVRLRAGFDLNPSGMALALAYLERLQVLEARIRELECQLLK